MARPLPDLKEAARRGSFVKQYVEALGGLKAAERAMVAAGRPLRYETLRDYIRGESVAPDDVLATLERLVTERPRWIKQKIKGTTWLVHLHQPPFAVSFTDGKPTAVQWFTGAPPAAKHGKLLAEAANEIAK